MWNYSLSHQWNRSHNCSTGTFLLLFISFQFFFSTFWGHFCHVWKQKGQKEENSVSFIFLSFNTFWKCATTTAANSIWDFNEKFSWLNLIGNWGKLKSYEDDIAIYLRKSRAKDLLNPIEFHFIWYHKRILIFNAISFHFHTAQMREIIQFLWN